MTATATADSFLDMEVQVRVFELDAAIARARLEVQRDQRFLKVLWYQKRAESYFEKAEVSVRAAILRMNDDQLVELARLLRKPLVRVSPAITAGESVRPEMRSFERHLFDSFIKLTARIEKLADDLQIEAARRRRDYPRLSARLQRDAFMANAFLPKVRRDPADADPDPDYGL